MARESDRASLGWPRWGVVTAVLAGLAILAVAAAVGLNVWVQLSPPVVHGSVVAGVGDAVSCDPTEFGSDASLTCYEVPFAEGEEVGIGFTVRNTAPIPMTIVRVESYNPPYNLPAFLQPQLIEREFVFGLDAGRPFEPVEVAPNEEVAMQLVGRYRPCEEVAEFQEPGSGVVITNAALTLRWAFAQTEVRLPLGAALSLPAPDSCPGT